MKKNNYLLVKVSYQTSSTYFKSKFFIQDTVSLDFFYNIIHIIESNNHTYDDGFAKLMRTENNHIESNKNERKKNILTNILSTIDDNIIIPFENFGIRHFAIKNHSISILDFDFDPSIRNPPAAYCVYYEKIEFNCDRRSKLARLKNRIDCDAINSKIIEYLICKGYLKCVGDP